MHEQKAAVSRQGLRRLIGSIRNFLKSPVSGKARLLLVVLFVLMLGINRMNIANSYIGGHIIAVNRNLSIFTSRHGYLIQLIQVLIVAQLFIGKNRNRRDWTIRNGLCHSFRQSLLTPR